MSVDVPREAVEAARGYEALFVPALFSRWTGNMVEAGKLRRGDRVLDVACGTGVLARDASKNVGRTGRVTGLDPAPGMIAVAREIAPDLHWVLGSAEEMPFEDAHFDAVLSQFGLMFFQDREGAVQEMFRVLVPGGQLAIAVWNTLDHNPAYRDVIAVLDDEVSDAAGDALRMPFNLGDAREATGLLETAGFDGIAVKTITVDAAFPSSRTMVEAELLGWLPLFGINLDEEQISEVLSKSDAKLAKYATSSGEAVFPTSAHVITATRPLRVNFR